MEARTVSKSRASSKTLTPSTVNGPLHSDNSTPMMISQSSQDVFSIMPHLTPTIDERAVNFFFSNHVAAIDTPSRGFIDHMQAHPDYELGENLMSSIKAVGLVGFSNVAKAPALLVEAKKQYLSAVRHLNAALQSPVEAKKDSTLMAVMILGIFETLVGRSENSLIAWAAHLNGASALMKIRGPEQLSTVAGRRLFGQITASLATSCLQQEIEMPEHIHKLRQELDKYIDTNNPIWQNHQILIDFTTFYARVKSGKITNLHSILNRSLELDEDLTSTFSCSTSDWTYSTVYTDQDPDIVYTGYYHVYQHALSAMIWNGVRTMRIMLNEIIRNLLLKGFSSKPPLFVERMYTEQLQKSTDTLYQTSSDIMASVPQHLGYTSSLDFNSNDSHFESPEPMLPRKSRQMWPALMGNRPDFPEELSNSTTVPLLRTASYQLPWALFLVGVTDIVTEPVLRWVIKTLRHISQCLGIQQAIILADRLEHTRLPSFTGLG